MFWLYSASANGGMTNVEIAVSSTDDKALRATRSIRGLKSDTRSKE